MVKSLNLKYVLLFSISVLISLFLWQRPIQSQWLSGWLYREPIVIKEQSGRVLTDYQVKITLSEDYFDFSLCKPDGSDIRFADEASNLLDFWIESWPDAQSTTKTAVIWVKITRLEPFEKKTIYLYYGNPLATSYSNLTATMNFIEVVRASVSSTPTTIPFINNPDVAVASPPTMEDTETCSINLYRRHGVWYASLSESSVNDNEHPTETAYFFGAPRGTFVLTDGTIVDASTAAVTASSGPLIKSGGSSWSLFEPVRPHFFVFASLNQPPADNAQLRLVGLRIKETADFYLRYSIQQEYDSTEVFPDVLTASFFRIKPPAATTAFFDSTRNGYLPVFFASTETTRLQFPFFHDGPFLVTLLTDGPYLPFLRLNSSDTSPALVFQYDETAPAADTTFSGHLSAMLLSSTGIFPAARYSSNPPSVYLARISGRVFEDSDLDGRFTAGIDIPKSHVRVRVYQDTNENGEIDDADLCILETFTDGKGEYYSPAKKNTRYLVAVEAASVAAGEKHRLLPGYTTGDILPEGYSTTNFIDGKLLTLIKPGGNNFSITDHWSDSKAPSDNQYEHTASVETGNYESITGIDFGFSYEIVTSSIDDAPFQGTLRQALINANALAGRQEIKFLLTPDDPGYTSLLSEYEIELFSALPEITDSVVIDGRLDDATVLIKNSSVYIDSCFSINAPATVIKNLRFAGFKTALVINEPQQAGVFQLPDSVPKDSLIPVASAWFSSPVFFSRNSLSFEPFIMSVDDFGKRNYWLSPDSSAVVVFDSRLSHETTVLPGPTTFFAPPEFSRMASIPLLDEFNIDLNPSTETALTSLLVDTTTLEFAPSYMHAGYRFTSSAFPGDNFYIVPVNTTSCPVAVEEIYSPQLSTSRSAVAPSILTVDATATILLSSSNPVIVFRNGTPLFPEAADLLGMISTTMTVVSSEDTFVDIFASNEEGSAHTSAFLARGSVYSLEDFPEISALVQQSTLTAVHVIAEKPLVVNGELPFIPSNRMATGWFVPFPADELVVASVFSTTVSAGTTSAALRGQLDSPGLVKISSTPGGSWVCSSAPVLVYYRNHLTGKLMSAFPNIEASYSADGFIDLPEPTVYDSDILVSGCTFLANTTAVVVNSGTGITTTNNRFVGNGYLIDLGNNGPDPIDGIISESLVNLGVDRPVIDLAVAEEGTTLTVSGHIGTTSTTEFASGEVEIYLADRNGQSNILLGRVPVENGRFTFVKTLSGMSVTAYDYVTAIYHYSDGSSSEFSEPVRVDPAPVISNVHATHILPASDTTPQPTVTTITWITDIPATSKVVYDTVSRSATETYSYETTETTTLVTTHTVVLNGLDTNTIYYFRVVSANEFSEVTTSYEFMIPPGRAEADTDLCAACHRAHTAVTTPLRLLPYQRP